MYSVNGNCFRISVRNLVEFMCAEGDIDNRNTGGNDVKIMQEGQGFTGKSSTAWELCIMQKCL